MGSEMPVKFAFEAESVVAEGRLSWEEIEELRKWVQIAQVPALNDEQIVCFLLSCDRDQEFTQKTIKEYYKARSSGPELFDNRNIENADIQKQLNVVEFSVFPKRTDDGCAIIFHRLHNTVYSNYNMEPSMKLLFMTLDITIYDNPPTGLVILFDMKGVGLMHLTKARIGLIRKFFHYLQEGLPVKLKAVHVFNSVYFLDKIMAIIKPFMKKEVMEMVHFHPPNLNMELFYEKYLPKKCLPVDFGGELASTQDLHKENTKKLQDMMPFFAAEEKQRIDTKK